LFEQLEPMSADRHGHLRLRKVADYSFAAAESQVPLVFSEMLEAAKHFAIVFPSASPERPVALLGGEAGRNHFVNESGRWGAGYLPAHLRRYPFTLATANDGSEHRYSVLLDRNAPHLSSEEGEPLFVDGELAGSGSVADAVAFLQRFQREADAVPEYFLPLVQAGVLVERSLDVRCGGTVVRRISGVRVADRHRLAALDDATLSAWARNGLLEAVHAHLLSLSNLRRLID
jgi:hypothetical protein